MIAFMIGGTALCVTSVILAWSVVGRSWVTMPVSSKESKR
jgi:hypothetical protein